MNVLMIVSWYTSCREKLLREGIFHNEQAVDLSNYCNTAIYFPFDKDMESRYSIKREWDVLTYRSKYVKLKTGKSIFLKIKNKILIQYNYLKIIVGFRKINKDFKPDILHVHAAGGAGTIGTLIGKLYRIPVVVTEHLPVEMMNYKQSCRSYNLGRYVYGNSVYNACVSRDLKDKLEELFPNYQFHTIYNGIAMPEVSGEKGRYYAAGYVNIGIVALLYDKEIKGMQFLLPAIKELIDSGTKIVLHHIGGGAYLEYYKKMAKELEIDSNCIFYGQRSKQDVNDIVNEMDFFVSASLVESAGVAVMEAMMLGKPVLGTKSGGVNSLVPDFAGIIVEKGSTNALVNGIRYMVKNYGSFDKDRIKKYAIDNFLIDNISKKYMKVYTDVLKKI